MDFNKIEAFINIVENGSITNAAEKLFISQSTLSDRLNSLETDLGTRLIRRGPGIKKLELTEKGVVFLDFAARYLELNNEIEEWKRNEQRLHIKIGAPQSINTHLFKHFYKKYISDGQFHLDISSHWNRTIYNRVSSFELDIGIVSRPYQSKQIVTERLLEEPLKVIYNNQYADYSEITMLEKQNQVYIGWGPAYEEWYNNQWDSKDAPLVTLDSPELLSEYLQTKNAWAIVPLCIFNEIINNNPNIVEIKTEQPIKRILYIIYQKGISENRNIIIEDFIKNLYMYVLEMENLNLCKVLMQNK